MKLSRRVRDLLQAGLRSPRGFFSFGRAESPEAKLEGIRKSLARAVTREKQLQEDLVAAEGEGRERDAIRLRRALADLSQSIGELRSALDLIEARLEMEPDASAQGALADDKETSETSESSLVDRVEEDGSDMAARKSRLAAPKKGQGGGVKRS